MKITKYYAVIDTNVLVSSFWGEQSIPGWIIKKVEEGIIVPLICDEIIAEYVDVLFRNRFNFDKTKVNQLINTFISKGIELEKTKTEELFNDADDIVFYEIALTGRKTMETYLVTGNKRDFPKVSFVVTPSEMKEIIEDGEK